MVSSRGSETGPTVYTRESSSTYRRRPPCAEGSRSQTKYSSSGATTGVSPRSANRSTTRSRSARGHTGQWSLPSSVQASPRHQATFTSVGSSARQVGATRSVLRSGLMAKST